MQTPEIKTFASPFALGEALHLDGGDIKVTVTGLMWQGTRMEIQVSWWNNGSVNSIWVAIDRLARAA